MKQFLSSVLVVLLLSSIHAVFANNGPVIIRNYENAEIKVEVHGEERQKGDFLCWQHMVKPDASAQYSPQNTHLGNCATAVLKIKVTGPNVHCTKVHASSLPILGVIQFGKCTWGP